MSATVAVAVARLSGRVDLDAEVSSSITRNRGVGGSCR